MASYKDGIARKRVTMDRAELIELAQTYLEGHRDTLMIDGFFKINVEVSEGDFHSKCESDDKAPLSWTIKLNPEKHSDAYDVQYSIIESLLAILLGPLSGDEKGGVIARIATAFCSCFAEEADEELEED